METVENSSGVKTFHKMFVYGTLKKGQRNHHILNDISIGTASFLGAAKLCQPFPLVINWGTPCLLPKMPQDKQDITVLGELYEVNDSMLSYLDDFEAHPQVYLRTPTECVLLTDEASKINCDVYFFNLGEKYSEMYSLPYVSDYKDITKKIEIRLPELLK